MSLRINNNTDALEAQRQLMANSDKVSKAMQKLSTGYRINSAADDAAGLGISERMRGQISGLAQAERNIQDGISLVQTAEGNLDEVHSMLQRVRELAVQYKNGTLSSADQAAIQTEVNQLASEIERIGSTAKFNSISLLNTSGSLTIQVGANDGDVVAISTVSLGSSLGTSWFSLTATGTADLSEIDAAINAVSAIRSDFGSVENRLSSALTSVGTYHENLVSAESRIRDVDMASAMAELTKDQILQQAGTAMLAQANQEPQSVLQLLRQ